MLFFEHRNLLNSVMSTNICVSIWNKLQYFFDVHLKKIHYSATFFDII